MAEKLSQVIFVVEGKDDTARLRVAFGEFVQTIETGGSKISSAVLDLIAKAEENHDIILLTDPDFQGERIRKIVLKRVPNVKQIFLNKADGRPHHKGSLGVEHADPDLLRQLLGKFVKENASTSDIVREDLSRLGLIDARGSAVLREKLAKKCHLGQVNGKQLLKRLRLFGITKKELKEAMKDID